MMNFAAVRNLNRIGVRNFRSFHKSIQRAADAPKDSCCGEKPAEKPAETICPPKAPEPPPKPEIIAPQPQPCPSMPQCPPAMCRAPPDPNNPCNYIPPECPDPDYPNLTRLKANQCRFQADDDVPVFLKRGAVDKALFQVTVLLVVVSLAVGVYRLFVPLKRTPKEEKPPEEST